MSNDPRMLEIGFRARGDAQHVDAHQRPLQDHEDLEPVEREEGGVDADGDGDGKRARAHEERL